MLIPYGTPNWPLDRLAEIAEGRQAGPPLAVARPGVMLRINSGALDLPQPPPTEAAVPMAERVEAHLQRLCGGWNKAASLFVARYFAFIRHQMEMNRTELEALLAPLEGLFSIEDYLFSAPLPLPLAFLPTTPNDFTPVDFAWWLGDRLVAVLLAPSPLTPMAARRRRERLESAGIAIADCTAADLNDPRFGWFTQALGHEGNHFWEGQVLPFAPGSAIPFDF